MRSRFFAVVFALLTVTVAGVRASTLDDPPELTAAKARLCVAAGLAPRALADARVDVQDWNTAWGRAHADVDAVAWQTHLTTVENLQRQVEQAIRTASENPTDFTAQSTVQSKHNDLNRAVAAQRAFLELVRARIASELSADARQRLSNIQSAQKQGIPMEYAGLGLTDAQARQLRLDLRHEADKQTAGEAVDQAVATRLQQLRARLDPAESSTLRETRYAALEAWFRDRLSPE